MYTFKSIALFALLSAPSSAFVQQTGLKISSPVCMGNQKLTTKFQGQSSAISPISMSSVGDVSTVQEPAITPEVTDSSASDLAEKPKSSLMSTLKVGTYFFLWYAFNIGYNVYNKKALNVLPLPWTMALIQLSVGLGYVFPLWLTGLRKAPKVTKENIKTLAPIASMHMGTHVSAVLSLGAGAVSFAHIIKAGEPIFTAGLSGVILKQIYPIPVYLALLPVIAGVGLASLTELSFSWLAFGAAMTSNFCSAMRGILAKTSMDKPQGENMTPANLYAVLTMISVAMLAPISLVLEGGKVQSVWKAAIAAGTSNATLWQWTILSAVFYYLYNEVAFLALDSVNPVTHAVGNTIKRVVIILASILIFGTKMTPLGAAGSTIAILGVLLYSLVKNHYK